MFLDGDKVAVRDRVFHITTGYGTVETIENGVARVRMDSGGVIIMYEDGYVGRNKQIYWYPPHFIMPRKGKQDLHRIAIKFAENAIETLEVMQHGS